MKKRPKESTLYPVVEKWMKRHFHCFKTGINTGLRFSRIDVFGIRDLGGDLASDVETIAIEVKRGTAPFATASGQTLGYKVYVHRVYLADYRDTPFSPDELNIANALGIGLIRINGNRCMEVLSSPKYEPISSLHFSLLEGMALGRCQICESIFETGEKGRRYANITRENIDKAIEEEKGVMFWNREVSERKAKLGLRSGRYVYERRFVCPDCVWSLFSQLKGTDKE